MKDFIKKEKIKSCWVNGHVKKSKYPPGKFLLFHHVKNSQRAIYTIHADTCDVRLIETQGRFESSII